MRWIYLCDTSPAASALHLPQYNLNGLGWNARTIPGIDPSPLRRRKFSDDGDVTDSTRHSAGNDIDADSDNEWCISDCWLITMLMMISDLFVKFKIEKFNFKESFGYHLCTIAMQCQCLQKRQNNMVNIVKLRFWFHLQNIQKRPIWTETQHFSNCNWELNEFVAH